MSETLPTTTGTELEIETPVHEVITSLGKIPCDWVNTTLKRFEDPYDNHIEYNDGEKLHKLNVLQPDWDKLSELKFPWDYYPDLSRFEQGDMIGVTMPDGADLEFRPRDTILCLFDDEKFNHVEHRVAPNVTRGVTVVPALWRMLFRGDFPVRYLPYVDRATLEFFNNLGKGRK